MAHYGVFRPWAASPWGAFDELRREMEGLFNRYDRGVPSGAFGSAYPAVNLYETAEGYVVTAELPGVDLEDIHVGLEGRTLSLRGERKIDYSDGDADVHRRERQSGSFHRAFELPVEIDAEKVDAVHRNGVLLLRLPKAPEHKPRQIQVTAG